tara:strand:- start:513 stop:728 length:216 start_codon:yes stop_codon:yes gene_type:complete
MKFSIVMSMCFAVGVCQTAIDDAKFDIYKDCIDEAKNAKIYLEDLYPGTGSTVECMDEIEITMLKEELGIE